MTTSTNQAVRTIPISEIFGPVAQGEGFLTGLRTMFIRTGACDGADGTGKQSYCHWCDSMFAVDGKNHAQWSQLTPNEIVAEVRKLSAYCKWATLSGGNPAVHDLQEVVTLLKHYNYHIAVETQGTIFRPWLNFCDVVTISPKPPSAGHYLQHGTLTNFLQRIRSSGPQVVMKVVVDPDNQFDYGYMGELAERYSKQFPFYAQVVTKPTDTLEQLVARYRVLERMVLSDGWLPDIRVGMQQHVVAHGHARGV